MAKIPFCKFHGFGNDYIVILRDDINGVELADLARSICHRHTGVGSDGIAVLDRRDGTADYYCEIVNPDGSTASFSGNGTRCAVAYLFYKGLWLDERLRLDTRSGLKTFDLIERKGEGEFWFAAEIGKPLFASEDIPVKTDISLDTVINEPISVDGREFTFSAVNIGNPVACVFVENFDFDWRSVGRTMESHEKFPARANIVFVKVEDAENIDLRIWERGAGETAASGTCSSGAAILSAYLNKTGREVHVHSPGGITDVVWRDDDGIIITGRADLAFCGEWVQ